MQRPNLYDYLKILALLSMIVDHIGYFLFPEEIWWRVLGRIAFPLFLLLVGYNGSYKRRSSLRIVGIGVQVLVWGLWYQGAPVDPMLNILLIIACTRVFLGRITRNSLAIQISAFISAVILFPRTFSWIDYGTLALAFGLAGWWIRTLRGVGPLRAWSILITLYMSFMIMYRGFPEQTWIVLGLVGVFLILLGILLSKGNTAYYLSPRIDTCIIWISTHALRIYVVHGAVLALVGSLLH